MFRVLLSNFLLFQLSHLGPNFLIFVILNSFET